MKKYRRCKDRMCGADDCPACHPENFQGGRYIEPICDTCGGSGTIRHPKYGTPGCPQEFILCPECNIT